MSLRPMTSFSRRGASRTRGSAPAGARARPRAPLGRGALVAVLGVLALARLARMAWPQIWIEDESYLNLAFMMSRGARPYVDFPLPHLPLLEGLLALLFQVLPASIRTAEAFTQAAAYAASVLVYVIGRRLSGTTGGVAAALVFATSGLLFRYHVFEREVFLIVPVLAATLLIVGRAGDGLAPREARGVAALLVVALAIKLTAVAAVAGIVAHLWWIERDRRSARTVLLWTVALAGLVVAGLAAAFGRAFLFQVVLFRWLHAGFPSLAVKLDELRYTLDVSLALGAGGFVAIAWGRRWRPWALPLALAGSTFAFVVFVNPTSWAHDGIELLPWLSLAAGALVADVVRAARGDRAVRPPAVAGVAVALILATTAVPIRNLNWQAGDGSVAGFGYRDRAEVEALASYVRRETGPDDLVATPPIIAFAANRREVVPYPEVAGQMLEVEALVAERGLGGALADSSMRERTMWDTIEASRDRWLPVLAQALGDRRARIVVNFSDDDLFPILLIDVPADALTRFGYTVGFRTAHYTAWRAPTSWSP